MRSFAEVDIRAIPGCNRCGIGAACGGGCRALAYALYGHVSAHNHFFCSALRKEAEDRLWRESEKKLSLPCPQFLQIDSPRGSSLK